jgi:hypothetical protein
MQVNSILLQLRGKILIGWAKLHRRLSAFKTYRVKFRSQTFRLNFKGFLNLKDE